MKGLYWTTITIIITAISLTFFVPTILGTTDEAIKQNAAVNAEELAGLINVLKSSPSGTVHIYTLPTNACKIEITNSGLNYVNEYVKPVTSYRTGFVQNDVIVEKSELECKSKRRKFFMMRCGNLIKISPQRLDCVDGVFSSV